MLSELNIITIFPEIIEEWKKYGVVNQGLKKKLITITTMDLRDWGIGSYKKIDDAPYGGGPGMVMMVEPLDNAIKSIKADKTIFLTASGQEFSEKLAMDMLKSKSLTIVCGRYEGFDERIIEMHSDHEISVGKTVVSGGEVPAMFIMEALIRKIPNVLGNEESLLYETYTNDKIDFPSYTRPENYKGYEVPEVLLSGNHKEIEEWKKNKLKDM